MLIGTKCRSAVCAMVDVALRMSQGPVPLTDIASRQHISLSYLEQLFSKLRHHGLVTSVRGPGGGYIICSHGSAITLADVIRAVEDDAQKVKKTDGSKVQDMTQKLWDTMNSKVLEFANTVTLDSLVIEQLGMGVKIEQSQRVKRGLLKKPDQFPAHLKGPNSVFDLSRTFRAFG